MKTELTTINNHAVMKWECCGLIFELMLSRLFEDRYQYAPTCPFCGQVGRSYSEIRKSCSRKDI